MSKLNKEEKMLLKEYDKGNLKSVKNKAKSINQNQEYARNTFQKDKRVNIRISTKVLEAIQKKAVSEGIPYQTLMSSILHKFVTGLLTEKKA